MSVSSSTICSECNEIATHRCASCNQVYCEQHGNKHQIRLDEQLDWLTVDHDDLKKDILQQISTPKYHRSMGIIDQWEEETIERIRYTAFLARRALIDAIDQHVLKVEKSLNELTEKLYSARNRIKSFNENDIKNWSTELQELRQIPMYPVTINKDINIYGLNIDFCNEKHITNSHSNHDTSVSSNLYANIDDSTASTSICNTSQCQIEPIDMIKKDDTNNKRVSFDDNACSYRSEIITNGGLVIIKTQQNNGETTILRQHPLIK